MKILYILGFIMTLSFIGLSQTYIDSEGNSQLWGKVQIEEFTKEPFNDWYIKNSKDYTPKLNRTDAKQFKDISVKVFIGTWCGDTQYLFPKFIKAWKQMGLSEQQLEILALHHEGELYKQGPNAETIGLDIHRVPTFIFYKDNQELGRIVERTVFNLETDMTQIVGGLPYNHRYQAVSILSGLMEQHIDSLDSSSFLESSVEKVDRELSTEAELNIYAYTLFFSGELDKAKFVFNINRQLFPYDPYVRYGYGRILYATEDYSEAKVELSEALRIQPDFDRAIKYLYEINKQME